VLDIETPDIIIS